jgi:histone H2A
MPSSKKAAATEIPSKQSSSAKAGILLPVCKLNKNLKVSRRSNRVSASAPVVLGAALEYVLGEMLEAGVSRAVKSKRKRVTAEDLMSGIRSDVDLHRVMGGAAFFAGPHLKGVHACVTLQPGQEESATEATR